MISKEVTDKKGQKRTVFADDEKSLADAVKAVEAQDTVKSIDINVPVEQGHDLVQNDEDGATLVEKLPETEVPEVEAPGADTVVTDETADKKAKK